MLRWILALLLIPFLDAVVLMAIVGLGVLTLVQTVLLVVLTALVGMLLVRAEGRRTMRKIQASLQRGEVPTDELLDGGLLIAAGAFLLTPGLVTDAIGFALAIPVTRYPIRVVVKKFVVTPMIDRKTGGMASGRVYTFGFPDPDEAETRTDARDDASGTGTGGGDTYDLSGDDYSVDDRDRDPDAR